MTIGPYFQKIKEMMNSPKRFFIINQARCGKKLAYTWEIFRKFHTLHCDAPNVIEEKKGATETIRCLKCRRVMVRPLRKGDL